MVEVPSTSQEEVLQDRFNQQVAVALQRLDDYIKILEARIVVLEAKP